MILQLRMILISTAKTVDALHSTVSPDFPLSLLHAFPAVAVIASPVVEHPFVLSPCGLVDLPPCAAAADLISSLEAVAGTAVVVLHEQVAVTAFGVANPGRPSFVDVPNTCSFPIPSSSVERFYEVFAGSSIDALSNYAPYN